jgi:hypothetical protein
VLDNTDDDIVDAGVLELVENVVEEVLEELIEDVRDDVPVDVLDDARAEVFDTWLLTINSPRPASQQVALFEP